MSYKDIIEVNINDSDFEEMEKDFAKKTRVPFFSKEEIENSRFRFLPPMKGKKPYAISEGHLIQDFENLKVWKSFSCDGTNKDCLACKMKNYLNSFNKKNNFNPYNISKNYLWNAIRITKDPETDEIKRELKVFRQSFQLNQFLFQGWKDGKFDIEKGETILFTKDKSDPSKKSGKWVGKWSDRPTKLADTNKEIEEILLQMYDLEEAGKSYTKKEDFDKLIIKTKEYHAMMEEEGYSINKHKNISIVDKSSSTDYDEESDLDEVDNIVNNIVGSRLSDD